MFSTLAFLVSPNLRAAVLGGPITNAANGHSYYLLEAAYWTNAEAEAVQLGGHLVTINDAAENAWVLGTFGNFGGVARTLFIGFTDQGHEGIWVWTSGEPVTYTNWNGGEPNNGGGGFPYENYSMMYGPSDSPSGFWNDLIGSLPEQQYLGVVEVAPLLSIRVSEVELCWPTISNMVYQVQYVSSLSGDTWKDLGAPITATGATLCVTDAVPAGRPQRFYRVLSVP